MKVHLFLFIFSLMHLACDSKADRAKLEEGNKLIAKGSRIAVEGGELVDCELACGVQGSTYIKLGLAGNLPENPLGPASRDMLSRGLTE